MKAHVALAAALVCALPGVVRGQAVSHVPAPDTEGAWALVPIARPGDSLPDGRTIRELGDRFWAGTAGLAFWAKTVETDKWALYSWRNGVLKLIAQEEAPIARRNGEAIGVHHGISWSSPRTVLVGGGDRLYLFGGGRHAWVYAWDGDQLLPVLLPGDTIRVRGVAHTVQTPVNLHFQGWGGEKLEQPLTAASLRDWRPLDARGRLVIGFRTGKPDELMGCAVDDGDRLRVLAAQGDTLPGGLVLKSVDCTFARAFGETYLASADAPGRSGFARIGGRAPGFVVYTGQPLPGLPGKKVNNFYWTHALGPDKLVYIDANGSWLIRGGSWTRLCVGRCPAGALQEPSRPDTRPTGVPLTRLSDVRDVDPDGPGLIVVRNDDMNNVTYTAWVEVGKERRSIPLFDTHANHSIFCYDGEATRRIDWQSALPAGTYGQLLIWPHVPTLPGVVFQIGVGMLNGAAVRTTDAFWVRSSDCSPVRLPTFTLTDGRKLGAQFVIGRSSPSEAIVSLHTSDLFRVGDEDGLYRLERKPVQTGR